MNHSHGYEMRLQTARELRKAEHEKQRAAAFARSLREERINALHRALATIEELPATLAAYELTGDHDHSLHGTKPVAPGAPCPGGDCMVDKARKIIKALADAKAAEQNARYHEAVEAMDSLAGSHIKKS